MLKCRLLGLFTNFAMASFLIGAEASPAAQNVYIVELDEVGVMRHVPQTDKEKKIVAGQLVAQEAFVEFLGHHRSLDQVIKEKMAAVDDRNQSYAELGEVLNQVQKEGGRFLGGTTEIDYQHQLVISTLEEVARNSGIYPSLVNLIKSFTGKQNKPAIVLLSRGNGDKGILDRLSNLVGEEASQDWHWKDLLQSNPEKDRGVEGGNNAVGAGLLEVFEPGSVISWKMEKDAPVWMVFDDHLDRLRRTFYLCGRKPHKVRALYDNIVLGPRATQSLANRFIVSAKKSDLLLDRKWAQHQLRAHRYLPLGHLQHCHSIPDLHPKPDQNVLFVLFYNILMCGLDKAGHEWNKRSEAIVSMIQGHDLIGLQELTAKQIAYIEDQLPEYRFIAVSTQTGEYPEKEAGDREEVLAIAYNPRVLTPKGSSFWWLSSTPNIPSKNWKDTQTAYLKMTQRAEFLYRENGQTIAFYNNHFANETVNGGVINPRRKAAEMELEYLRSDLARGILPVTGGDRNFQFGRDDKVYRYYLKHLSGLEDPTWHDCYGIGTTILGYKDQSRCNAIDEHGNFTQNAYLDVVYVGTPYCQVLQTRLLSGEYDEGGELLPPCPCQDVSARRFASDHGAVSLAIDVFPPQTKRSHKKGSELSVLPIIKKG